MLRRLMVHKWAPIALLVVVLMAGITIASPHSWADSVSEACAGAGLQVGADGNCGGGGSLNGVFKAVINVLSAVVGVVAVIMMIVGGFRYVTSGGEANAVSAAKKTIIYALVGLVVVAMAQVIVHFVIHTATGG